MNAHNPVVFVVDDEVQIRRLLRVTLAAAGYTVLEAASAEAALPEIAGRRPDLVILDLGLPDMDGLDVLRRIREWSAVPVIVLTVRDDEEDKITLLDAGADDYLTKPFSGGELLARIRTALRHARSGEHTAAVRAAGVHIDLVKRLVTRDGEPIRLTATEYRLLAALAQHPGRVMTHRQLLKDVWGPQFLEETHYLRIYMAQLRRKLEADPANPVMLVTEPGIGYRLMGESDTTTD